MNYKNFHNVFCNVGLDNKQIRKMQMCAFEWFKDAHGHRPNGRAEKGLAYDFAITFMSEFEMKELSGFCQSICGMSEKQSFDLYNELGNLF